MSPGYTGFVFFVQHIIYPVYILRCLTSTGVYLRPFCRSSLDVYGSTFLLGSHQAKDAILFAARPGLRVWKVCGVTGVVQSTYIFRDLMTEPSQGIELLPDTMTDSSLDSVTDRQFGHLLLFNDTHLVTYRGTRLCVIDPGLGQFVGYHGNLGYILCVAVCKDEIFVLRKMESGRRLLRLGYFPQIEEGKFL